MTSALRLILPVLLILPAGASHAQTRPEPRPSSPRPAPATPTLSLSEAEAMLVERNLAVTAARRGVDIARAQRLVADTRPAPELGFSQTAGQLTETRRLQTAEGARGYTPLQNSSFSISLVIERGGKRELRTRFAEEQIAVADAQVLDALRGQVFALRQAFIQGLQARADYDVALANRTALDRTEALLREQVRQGSVPESDLLRFQASRLPFAQDLAAAAQSYAAASAQVAVLVGADATRVTAHAGAGLQASAAIALRGRLDAAAASPLSREVLAEALPNRPDVLAATRAASAAGANARLADAGQSRDVTLNGSLNRTEIQTDLPGGARAITSVGVGASIPIFTSRLVQGNRAAAAAQQSQAEAQAAAALVTAQGELATAWAGYQQAQTLVQLTAGPALRRAEEAYASTEAAYRAGGRTLLDVLDALRTLNATRVSANAARAQLMLSLATLEQASGVSGIAPRL